MRKELLKGLTEEQKKKVAECNNAEEILALAKAEGVALNDEQLEAVSGGSGCFSKSQNKCPECGSKEYSNQMKGMKKCKQCGTIY